MKITFGCTGCGKTLRARPDAVGRTRKCPVCATRVTCPEPVAVAHAVVEEVFEAELVEAEVVLVSKPTRSAAPAAARRGAPPPVPKAAAAVDALVDDDDAPYALVGADTVAGPPTEPRKPCPMCGETILAAAAKCRFCGEVFDSRLKKGGGRRNARSRRRAGAGARAASAASRSAWCASGQGSG